MKTLLLIFTTILITLIVSCDKIDFNSSHADSKIIFISRRTSNSGSWNLLSMNKDGSSQNKITDLAVRYGKPVISHSGETVVFVHYTQDYFYELYSINIDGTRLKLIDRAKRSCGYADWSIDDSKIIYSKNRNDSTNDKDLILFDTNTDNKVSLTQTGDNISPKFSPDNRIAFCQQTNLTYDLYLMDIDGSNKQLIGSGGNPVWSPDGKKIAFVNGVPMGSPQIYVTNANGTDIRQLTTSFLPTWDSGFPSFGNYNPLWTPDGRKIIYQSDVNDGHPEIYIMNSDGSNQSRLTSSGPRNEDPEVSSDGRFILFNSNRDLNFGSEIYVMDIDGKNQYSISKYIGDDCLPGLIKK